MPDLYLSYLKSISSEVIVLPVELVILNIIDFGEGYVPEDKKPIALSVETVAPPLAKLKKPPGEELVSTPEPDVPPVLVVSVVPPVYSVPFASIKPSGKVAVADVPIALKFCTTGTSTEGIDIAVV